MYAIFLYNNLTRWSHALLPSCSPPPPPPITFSSLNLEHWLDTQHGQVNTIGRNVKIKNKYPINLNIYLQPYTLVTTYNTYKKNVNQNKKPAKLLYRVTLATTSTQANNSYFPHKKHKNYSFIYGCNWIPQKSAYLHICVCVSVKASVGVWAFKMIFQK